MQRWSRITSDGTKRIIYEKCWDGSIKRTVVDNVQLSFREFLIIMVIIGLFIFWCFVPAEDMMFEMPNEAALNSDNFRKMAEKQAIRFLIREQENAWDSIGFSSERGAKTYDLREGYRAGDIAERTKYYQGGTYQVLTSTNTILSSTSPDGKTTQQRLRVEQQFIVTLSTKPKRKLYGTVDMNWKLVDIKLVKMDPNIEKINDVIHNWKVPSSKKANW